MNLSCAATRQVPVIYWTSGFPHASYRKSRFPRATSIGSLTAIWPLKHHESRCLNWTQAPAPPLRFLNEQFLEEFYRSGVTVALVQLLLYYFLQRITET